MNIETVGVTLPPEAPEIFEPLAHALGERTRRDARRARRRRRDRWCGCACMRARSAARAPIAEFAARTVGRLLDARLRPGRPALASAGEVRARELLAPRVVGSRAARRQSDVQRPRTARGRRRASTAAYHLFDIRLTGGRRRAARRTPWIVVVPAHGRGRTRSAQSSGDSAARAGLRARASRGRDALRPAHRGAASTSRSRSAASSDAAVTDALTGLLNRRGFDERLSEELERALRSRHRPRRSCSPTATT